LRSGSAAFHESTKKRDYKKALKRPVDVVLVVGGDGTVGKVGRELIDSGISLGVLPLGTASNLARSLGFTASPEEIIAASNAGRNEPLTSALREGRGASAIFLKAPEVVSSRIILVAASRVS
jgi:diacylglycerol kinase family enzyme